MSKPTVSVIIPLYNAEAYIADTLKSVLNQSFQDFEVIIIDDGSRDKGSEIAQKLIGLDSRFRIRRQSNQGVSATRNRGAQEAHAPLLAFLDADDLWHKTYLEKLVRHMQHNKDIAIAYARTRFIDATGNPTGAISSAKTENLTLVDMLCGNPTTTCSNLIVRREVFLKSGGFLKGLNHAEDQLWLIQQFLSGNIIKGLDEVLLDYRTNMNGLSSDTTAMAKGWEEMIALAQSSHPQEILPAIKPARALNRLYLAQRAYRTSKGIGRVLQHISQAFSASPWVSVNALLAKATNRSLS